jgi:hypothetical protein
MSLLDIEQNHPKLYAKIFRKGLSVGKSIGTQGRIEIDEPLNTLDYNIVIRDLKRYHPAKA